MLNRQGSIMVSGGMAIDITLRWYKTNAHVTADSTDKKFFLGMS